MWLLVGLALWWCLTPVRAWGVSTSASAAVLMDADTGQVLYDHNGSRRMLIASTTKIMTALVAVENVTLSDVVTIKSSHMAEGSSMYLKVGEKLTLETLLYGLLLCSGNDAAVAIAEHISGSQEDFAKLMNATAREIGMEHSSFANPNGLDHEDHYSTARDMARLACAAVENETLVQQAISNLVKNKTVLIIAHRMRTVAGADRIVVLKDGYVAEQGTPEELLEKKGIYHHMAELQGKSLNWSL